MASDVAVRFEGEVLRADRAGWCRERVEGLPSRGLRSAPLCGAEVPRAGSVRRAKGGLSWLGLPATLRFVSGAPLSRQATLADYLALPEHSRAELLRGALVERETTGPKHGRALLRLGASVTAHFDRKPGGKFPGGWWIVSDVAVRFDDEVLRPDLAGWRRERVEGFPLDRPVTIVPDWVCEIVSPSNARTDRVLKLRTYHAAQVPHYWLVDPEEQTLTVFRYGPGGYVVALTATVDEVVAAEPFDAVRLPVATLFLDEPAEE